MTIHEWYGNRPQIQPPHVRDLLAPEDSNYGANANQLQEGDEDASEPDMDDPMDFPETQTSKPSMDTTTPQSPIMASLTPARGPSPSKIMGTPSR